MRQRFIIWPLRTTQHSVGHSPFRRRTRNHDKRFVCYDAIRSAHYYATNPSTVNFTQCTVVPATAPNSSCSNANDNKSPRYNPNPNYSHMTRKEPCTTNTSNNKIDSKYFIKYFMTPALTTILSGLVTLCGSAVCICVRMMHRGILLRCTHTHSTGMNMCWSLRSALLPNVCYVHASRTSSSSHLDAAAAATKQIPLPFRALFPRPFAHSIVYRCSL